MRQSPSASEKDLRNILARYAAYPRRVDQEIARLRLGMDRGWVGARPVLERALARLDGQLLPDVMRSPMAKPFTRIGADVPEARAQALRDEAAKALGERFDVRKFHMVLLDQGAIPLDLLEQRVDGWIAAQLKASKS